MLCCLNPHCPKPQNADDAKVCVSCGTPLIPLLRGRYRPTALIGQGGFGRTYLATDEDRLGTRCVIKQFSPQVQGSRSMQKAVQLFNQEAVRLYELGEHPQIPALLAYFEHDKYLYLVQQFIEGQSLVQQVRQQGAFSEAQLREMLVDLLPVLQFVHDRHVIHRDITPNNILRRELDKRLVLIDFGVAKQITAASVGHTGTRIGTEGYAPIEQFRSGRAYPASDLYSLGATCLYLLTETRPDNLYDPLHGRWLWRHYLHKKGMTVSDRLAYVLDKMLKDLVQERYQSAVDVLRDLEVSQSIPSIPAIQTPTPSPSGHRPPPPPPLSRPTRTPPRSQQPVSSNTSSSSTAVPSTVSQSGSATALSPSGVPPSQSGMPRSTGRSGQPSITRGGGQGCQFTLGGHTSWITCVAVSPDRSFVASSSLDDTVKLWKTDTGELITTLTGHVRAVNSIAISPDGSTLVSGSDDYTIKMWSLPKGDLLRTLTGHSRDVNAIAISPDARILASGGEDRTIRLWQFESGAPIRTLFGVAGMIKSIAITPDGKTLVSGGFDNKIKLWSLQTGDQLQAWVAHRNSVNAVALSPDGLTLASGSKDRTIKLWNPKTGALLNTLTGHGRDVNAIAFTPNGKTLVSGSSDATILFWNLSTLEVIHTLRGHVDAVNAIALMPDGSRLVSGSSDKTVKIWDMPTL